MAITRDHYIIFVILASGLIYFAYFRYFNDSNSRRIYPNLKHIHDLTVALYKPDLTYAEMDRMASQRYEKNACSLNETIPRFLIVVPAKDRRQDLLQFLLYMPSYFCHLGVRVDILVVEQISKGSFNKGLLFNAAIREVDRASSSSNPHDRLAGYDCFAFHDIDKLPVYDKVPYVCKSGPHCLMTERRYENGFSRSYSTFLGGIVMFTREQLEKMNGASNSFLNWGGEDDDLWNRANLAKMTVYRPKPEEGIFYEFGINHKRVVNPDRFKLLATGNNYQRMMEDGLKQANYKLVERVDYNTFVWLSISF
nr:beta 14 galactosyltransferase 4 [Hymenolepis microstoma]